MKLRIQICKPGVTIINCACITFISATEHDDFNRTFIGTGESPFTVRIDPNGFMTGIGRTTFTGTVDYIWHISYPVGWKHKDTG